MNSELYILVLTAISIAFVHTLFGPDHYLPFIVLAKARKWSMIKTVLITFFCGVGHVGSSVILGLIGVGFGVVLNKLEFIEGFRGNIAAWLLIAFGFCYMVYGLKNVFKAKSHSHSHCHDDGEKHEHEHSHFHSHSHVHESKSKSKTMVWTLFLIFVFGPCEPLIPILMYPAAKDSVSGVVIVSVVFAAVTISTMIGMVVTSVWGLSFIPLKKLEKYSHACAGFSILASGLAIQFLGL